MKEDRERREEERRYKEEKGEGRRGGMGSNAIKDKKCSSYKKETLIP